MMYPEFHVDRATGLISPARFRPSPNRDARPQGVEPDMLIVHSISLPPGRYGGGEIEALFTNCLDWDAHPYFDGIRGLAVSAHLLIRRDGGVLQFVPFGERAWHAGESRFRNRRRLNDTSIGVELEGDDDTPFDDRQYPVLAAAIHAIMSAYPGLSPRRIAGHADVSPGRKTDPGPVFDWLRLYDGLAGLAAAGGGGRTVET